jgi:hypothetical protein
MRRDPDTLFAGDCGLSPASHTRLFSHAVRFIVADHETLLAPQEIHQNAGEAGIAGTSSTAARSFTRAIASFTGAKIA